MSGDENLRVIGSAGLCADVRQVHENLLNVSRGSVLKVCRVALFRLLLTQWSNKHTTTLSSVSPS